MASFLYFVEGAVGDPPITRQRLHEMFFPHAAHAATPGAVVARGPSDKPGFVFPVNGGGAGRIEQPQGYYPDLQKWTCADDTAAAPWWFGVDPDARPRPDDLIHDDPARCHSVRLADGREWKVPVIRCADGSSTMEWFVTLEDDTRPHDDAGHLAVEDKRTWDIVTRLARRLIDPDVVVGNPDLNWLIGDVFARVYRVSPVELKALGLFTNKNLQEVFSAMLDIPTMITNLGKV